MADRPIIECGGADGQIHRQMKHKDSEKMVSAVTLLEDYSHIHTERESDERERETESKRGRER